MMPVCDTPFVRSPETLNCMVPWMKSDFLRCKKFNYVPDFDLVIVEGSKLGTKSNYNCRTKSRQKIEYVGREYYYFGHT